MHSFYIEIKIPSLDTILKSVNDDDQLPHELNLTWEKIHRKSILLDKKEIVCCRKSYLRYRSEEKAIYHLDKTWVNEGR